MDEQPVPAVEPAYIESHAVLNGVLPLFAAVLVRPVAAFRALRHALPGQWLFPAFALCLAMAFSVAAQSGIAAPSGISISVSISTAPTPAPTAADEPGAPAAGDALLRSIAVVAGQWIAWIVQATALLAAAVLLGGRATWGAIFRALVWASAPLTVGYAAAAAWTAVTGNAADFSAATLVSTPRPEGAPAGAVIDTLAALLLHAITPFTLWHLILVGVAMAVTARLSRWGGVVVGALNVIGCALALLVPGWLVLTALAQSGARAVPQ